MTANGDSNSDGDSDGDGFVMTPTQRVDNNAGKYANSKPDDSFDAMMLQQQQQQQQRNGSRSMGIANLGSNSPYLTVPVPSPHFSPSVNGSVIQTSSMTNLSPRPASNSGIQEVLTVSNGYVPQHGQSISPLSVSPEVAHNLVLKAGGGSPNASLGRSNLLKLISNSTAVNAMGNNQQGGAVMRGSPCMTNGPFGIYPQSLQPFNPGNFIGPTNCNSAQEYSIKSRFHQ